MTCLEAQSLITLFINDELDFSRMEKFLEHVKKCDECKEELEVYYALLTGMKQLDEDKHLSSDFHGDLIKKLKLSEEKIIQKKIKTLHKRIILLAMVCLFAVFSGFGVREYVEELFIVKEEPEESNFSLDYYFFKNRETALDKIVEEHYDTMMIYKRVYENRIEQYEMRESSLQPNRTESR